MHSKTDVEVNLIYLIMQNIIHPGYNTLSIYLIHP